MAANSSETETRQVIRASRSTCLVFLAIWAVPAALVLTAAVARHWPAGSFGMMLVLVAYGLSLLLWVSAFRIELNERTLIYRSLLGGRREIARGAIGKVTIQAGIRTYADRFGPLIRLEVSPKPHSGAKKLLINLKVFDRRAMDRLVSDLSEKATA